MTSKIPLKNSILFKEFKNHNCSGYVDRQQVTSIDKPGGFLRSPRLTTCCKYL